MDARVSPQDARTFRPAPCGGALVHVTRTVQVLLPLTGAGCLLVAGVFAAFTWLVLPAFARTGAATAAPAMQAVNVAAVRAPLLLAVFGTGAACLVLLVLALLTGRPWVAVGCGTYLLGCLGVTVAGNVPLNDRLAAAPEPEAVRLWARWALLWGRWNTVRLLACVAAGLTLLASRTPPLP